MNMNMAPTRVATANAAALSHGRRERRALSASTAMASRMSGPHRSEEVRLQVVLFDHQPTWWTSRLDQHRGHGLGRTHGARVGEAQPAVVALLDQVTGPPQR